MDTVITRKNRKNSYRIGIVLLFLIVSYFAYSMITKEKSLNIKRDEVTIKPVSKAYFEDFIIFQAKVEPLHSILINIIEGGSVQEIFVENGGHVEKGQALAKLYNPNTELSYLTQETSMIEQINNLNKARLDIRNQELNLAKDLIAIEHDYNTAKQLYDLNERLFKKGIIAKNEWETTREGFRYQQERKNIIQQSIQKEKQTNQIQIQQINRSIATMEKSLDILRGNKKNFLITAPLSGRLSSFEPILGKNYQAGESIGKIDVMQGYKLLAKVDEYYLERVSVGQKGTIEYKGKQLPVHIAKVIPEVKEGKFQVELDFENAKELDLKQGLSFGVKLILSESLKTLVLPKGSFNQETAGSWIFVVNGDKAIRRPIKLGRENPLYFEVLEGLKDGEKVITSSYQDYKEVAVLQFEK